MVSLGAAMLWALAAVATPAISIAAKIVLQAFMGFSSWLLLQSVREPVHSGYRARL
jgi:hypothetical protein